MEYATGDRFDVLSAHLLPESKGEYIRHYIHKYIKPLSYKKVICLANTLLCESLSEELKKVKLEKVG